MPIQRDGSIREEQPNYDQTREKNAIEPPQVIPHKFVMQLIVDHDDEKKEKGFRV